MKTFCCKFSFFISVNEHSFSLLIFAISFVFVNDNNRDSSSRNGVPVLNYFDFKIAGFLLHEASDDMASVLWLECALILESTEVGHSTGRSAWLSEEGSEMWKTFHRIDQGMT